MSRPANTLYRHNLTATLETAIRGSTSATDHPDIVRRLDARMLEYSQGEIGWDVFTLEYKVDAPVDTILDPEAMTSYLRVFNQLWRLKRTEYAVHATWQRLLTSTTTTRYVPHLQSDFHRARIVLAEMAHFVRQMQYWAHLDVIACQWEKLEDVCAKKQGDLDSLIEAHREYLDNLVSNVLLLLTKPGKEVRPFASLSRCSLEVTYRSSCSIKRGTFFVSSCRIETSSCVLRLSLRVHRPDQSDRTRFATTHSPKHRSKNCSEISTEYVSPSHLSPHRTS